MKSKEKTLASPLLSFLSTMRHSFAIVLLSVIPTFVGWGCDASPPGGNGELGPDASVEIDADLEEGVTLQIEGIPPKSYWDSVPVFGKGPKNGTVIVEGSAGTVSVDLASDGSFCVDVPLQKGNVNTLVIRAINQRGERSESQTFSLSQEGEPPEPGEPVPATNVALGGLPTVWSTVDEEEGTFSAMTDGSISTSVVLQNAVTVEDYLVLRLPVADGVEKLRITSDLACHLSDYLIFTAKTITPEQQVAFGALEMDEGPWTFRGHSGQTGVEDVNVTDCSTGTYSCQEYNFDSSVMGFVGFRFLNDVCSNTFGLGERRMRQVEAWTPVGVAPPTVSAPTCQGG